MTGPLPVVADVRNAVRAELSDVVPGTLVLVACSGGADSLALAAATAFVAPRAGLRAGAVVVDHGLQPGSDTVARRAAEQCQGLGLDPVEVVRVDVPGSGAGGPESAARTARYAALEATAARLGGAVVLLGHTRDDQAETVLLALARGSGGRSLAGMAHRRGPLRRPLLGLPRRTTEAVCAGLGLEPWHDPTNQPSGEPGEGPAPRRSRVRHEVLPVLEHVLGPGVPEALARTADQLREDADLLDLLASEVLAAARAAAGPGAQDEPPAADASVPEGLDVDVLARAPAPLRRRALRAALAEAGVPAGSLHLSHVLAVEALVTGWHGQGAVALPGGRAVRRRCGRLTVEVAPV